MPPTHTKRRSYVRMNSQATSTASVNVHRQRTDPSAINPFAYPPPTSAPWLHSFARPPYNPHKTSSLRQHQCLHDLTLQGHPPPTPYLRPFISFKNVKTRYTRDVFA